MNGAWDLVNDDVMNVVVLFTERGRASRHTWPLVAAG
jgi:hypothetical protein